IKKKLTMTPEEAQRQADKDLLRRMMNPPPGIDRELLVAASEERDQRIADTMCLTPYAEEMLKSHQEFFERLGGEFSYEFAIRHWEADVCVTFLKAFELKSQKDLMEFKTIATHDSIEMQINSAITDASFKITYCIPNAYRKRKDVCSDE
ncbi:MAG: hypothetical protein NC131_16040, partial [Roseburia sp.]|nr:hypothetical protein [Roseburia sp.]